MPKSTVVMAERAGFEPATELWALCWACDGLVRVTFDHGATSPPRCGKVGARPEKNNHLDRGIDWRKTHEREHRLPIGSGLHAPCHLSLVPSQPGVEPARGDQVLDVVDALVLRSEEHTSELQSRGHLVCRLLLEKKKNMN